MAHHNSSIADRIAAQWEAAFWAAMGTSHADPSACADAKVAPLVALLHRVERAQARTNGHLQRGCRAGRNRTEAV